MAIYVPTRTRRRRVVLAAVAALAVGVLAGFWIGRATSPSADDQIRSIQDDGREISAGLRVIALHGEAKVANEDDGTALVLARTESELRQGLDAAIWIDEDEGDALIRDLRALAAIEDRSSPAFGEAAEDLATKIDERFGNPPS